MELDWIKNNILLVLLSVSIILVFVFGPGLINGISYGGTSNMQKAPEIGGISNWINSQPLNISGLRGKVVLVDFWTYSCINCIRTLPYIKAWQEAYADKGLVIIGVHTPEFDFEKNYDNVKNFVDKNGIKYAVAMDNDYVTWGNYNNNYWPRKYIVDAKGFIRYDHIGEGGYEETEKIIQKLLVEANSSLTSLITTNVSGVQPGFIQTPEIYFGYNFARQNIGNAEGLQPEKVVDYKPVHVTQDNVAYLEGSWKINGDNAELKSDAGAVRLIYTAKSVNIVAGGNATLEILVDGAQKDAGSDIINKNTINIDGFRLYNIVSSGASGKHLVEINATGSLMLYTFTFG
ncbi:MAG: redoxin domain-containing protein [Candidatus Aenigmarchaeota archaeon]|nr:redoxin domain-containing protein [Candidatus Aenigmarchaeota archaeon]